MINTNLVDLFDRTIENWNNKQKMIAENLLVDPTYEIIEIYDNNKSKLFLKDKSNIVIDFEEYVKSKCNC